MSHSSGGWKSNIKVSAGWLLLRPLSSACRQVPSCYTLTRPFLCAHPPLLSLPLMPSFSLNYLFKGRVSKPSHTGGKDFTYDFGGDTIQCSAGPAYVVLPLVCFSLGKPPAPTSPNQTRPKCHCWLNGLLQDTESAKRLGTVSELIILTPVLHAVAGWHVVGPQ